MTQTCTATSDAVCEKKPSDGLFTLPVIAGIAVGAVVLLAAVAFFIRRKRRSSRGGKGELQHVTSEPEGMAMEQVNDTNTQEGPV